MDLIERYTDEDTSVALVFADGINFVETPTITYSGEAKSPNYPGKVGHPDTGYSVYSHKFTNSKGEGVKIGTIESVILGIYCDVFDTLYGRTKNSKIILGANWHTASKWATKIGSQDQQLISQLMNLYSKRHK